jgi:hypothetical protein
MYYFIRYTLLPGVVSTLPLGGIEEELDECLFLSLRRYLKGLREDLHLSGVKLFYRSPSLRFCGAGLLERC